MADEFKYDVFLSHSAKDKAIVQELAEQLRSDGLRVWFDEWEIRPGDSIPSKIEDGLEHSRVLVLCMSAHVFGSDWAQLEYGTFRFRDPLNQERRFIPLRLDEAPIKGSLAQLHYISWLPADRERGYARLHEACRNSTKWPLPTRQSEDPSRLKYPARIAKTRQKEWRRLRADFKDEASKYHDLHASVLFITRNGSDALDRFSQPNHLINLWQYYDSAQSESIVDRIISEKLTRFGITGAEVSAFALISGEQTQHFCRMASRAGSLLPDDINHFLTGEIAKKIAAALESGKPVLTVNRNPLAKWLKLILLATTTSHPERFRDGKLAADPFAASLTVFDYFRLGDQAVPEGT